MAWMFVTLGGATAAGIVVPLLIRRVVDGPVRHHQPGGLLLLGLLALLLGAVEALLNFVRRWSQSRTSLELEYEIRNDLYAHLQRLPIAFHDRWQSGQLLSRITTDLSVIRRFLSFGLLFLVVNVATYVAVVVLLLRLYLPLGIVVALSGVPLLLSSRQFSRQYLTISRLQQDQLGDLATLVEESAQGVRVIKSFGRRRYMGGRFGDQARLVHDTGVRKARLLARSWAEFDAVPNVTLAIVLVGGAYAVATGGMTVGGLVAFISLQLMLIWPIDALGWIIANGQESMTAADRIYEVFDVEPSIVDGARAVDPGTVAGELRFEGVEFRYPGAEEPILRDINLTVAAGETVAIVGVTGSGKTSLVSLVPRLYDVTAGRITLDGRDIRDWRLADLRAAIGYVEQDAPVLAGTMRANLCLASPTATDGDLRAVVTLTNLGELIGRLPHGLDTLIGHRGTTLSGGERQRIAIARALLRRPRILLLDEATSQLDAVNESALRDLIRAVARTTTVIVVAHRLSTVVSADRILVVADGRVRAMGTHEELLGTDDLYRDLAATQLLDSESGIGYEAWDGAGARVSM